MNILIVLALNFFLISLVAIGGVSAALPEIHRIFVDQLHLLDEVTFSHLYALSQASPGPNLMFVGLFGWHMAGATGALVSLVSLCGPTLLLAIGVEQFGSQNQNSPVFTMLKSALVPISIGLLASTVALLLKSQANWKLGVFTVLNLLILFIDSCINNDIH